MPQYITLEIVGPKALELGAAATHTFDENGGSIGRQDDNDWVIDDSYVSRYQALIGFASGSFYLEAHPKASAPMSLNGRENQVRALQKYRLNAGDEIRVHQLLIRVDLPLEQPDSPGPLFGSDRAPDFGAEPPYRGTGTQRIPPFAVPEEPAPVDSRGSRLSDSFPPFPPAPLRTDPSDTPAPPVFPERWWEQQPSAPPQPQETASAEPDEPRPPAPERVAQRPAAQEPGGAQMPPEFAAFLEGAGIGAANLTPQAMASLGRILRIVIQGTVELLRARDEIRREFAIERTQMGPVQNNALKWSANAEDALQNLLLKTNQAYLAPVESFEQAFTDLQAHQLAVLQGLRAGYSHMLGLFDPKTLESRFEPEKQAGFRALQGRPRFWEQYREWFAQMTEDETDCFRRLFAGDFARAYERGLQEAQRMQADKAGEAQDKLDRRGR